MAQATVSVYPFSEAIAPDRAIPKERLNWIDTARGITIFLVVMGHAGLPAEYQHLFQPVRMPLFYLTAGYLFNWERHREALGQYLRARLERLVLPYLFTALFFYLVWILFDYALLDKHDLSPAEQLAAVFLANGFSTPATVGYTLQFDMALWFLGCMAVSTLIFVGLLGLFRNEKTYIPLMLTSLGVAALGRLLGENYPLPWSADVAMMAQFFFVVGFLLRQYGAAFTDIRMFAFFCVIYVALLFTGYQTDMNRRMYPDFSQFCMAGLAGTYAIYFISKQLSQLGATDAFARRLSVPWEFLGRNTMVIMAFHMGGFYLRQAFELFVLKRPGCDPDIFWANFLWMSVASLMAIFALNRIELLKKVFYK
ncbi:acyltransferase family protein [bacterium]|nr:acyltransferase family protein [bacterium]